MFSRYSLNRMVVLAVTAGFALLLADTILEHRDVLTKEIMSLVPVFMSALGLVAGVVAVARWTPRVIRVMQGVLIASILVGLVGVYMHVREEDEDEAKPAAVEHQAAREEEKEKEKSPLAPLSFAGLAAIGLLGTSRKWAAE